jgi:hypothetical protein
MNNSKKSQKKTVNPLEKQSIARPGVQTKPKEKQPKPIVATAPKKREPLTKPSIAPKSNPNLPSKTGKPSGKGRGNKPQPKKMTEEAAKRIKMAEEKKDSTVSKDGFAERAKKAAKKNK